MTYIVYKILTLQLKMKNRSLISGVIVSVFSATLSLMQEGSQFYLAKV